MKLCGRNLPYLLVSLADGELVGSLLPFVEWAGVGGGLQEQPDTLQPPCLGSQVEGGVALPYNRALPHPGQIRL